MQNRSLMSPINAWFFRAVVFKFYFYQ